jgi:muramidase (phage lysozyme)
MELQFLEKTILTKIKSSRIENVLMLPCDIWASLLYYCEQTEDYTSCILLRDIEDKVIIKTLSELLNEYDKDYEEIK